MERRSSTRTNLRASPYFALEEIRNSQKAFILHVYSVWRWLPGDFLPTLHHAEKIPGEGRKLMDKDLGLYEFDDLIVLKTAAMPAVLLECGVIVNRSEEASLQTPEIQHRIVGRGR